MARPGGVKPVKVALRLSDPVQRSRVATEIGKRPDFELVEVGDCDVLLSDGEADRTTPVRCATVLWGDGEAGDYGRTIKAVLPASLDTGDVLSAVRLVAAGLVIHRADRDEAIADGDEGDTFEIIQELTSRERQVLQRLAAGDSNKEIANRLGLSVHTVKFHVSSILLKLGASSRLEAVGIGLRNGIVMI